MKAPSQTAAESQPQNAPQLGELLCQGDLTEVHRLLATGVDANAFAARFNWSALMLVNSVEVMVDLLLQAGADMQRVDQGGG